MCGSCRIVRKVMIRWYTWLNYVLSILVSDQLKTLTRRTSDGGAPVQILAVAADSDAPVPPDSPPAPALDRTELQAAADALGGRWTEATPDDGDIRRIIRGTVTRVVASAGDPQEARWSDAGYWLVFAAAAFATMWFRPGWENSDRPGDSAAASPPQ